MKTNITTFALMAIITSSAFAALKAPMPEFKNEKQLAEWRAGKATQATSQGYIKEEPAFYTGKPYLASSGSYAFKYRSYSPELARWTSEDPSGFPDGANGNIYAPTPTSSLDFSGLWKIKITNYPDGSNSGIVNTGSPSQDDTINSKAKLSLDSGKVYDPTSSIYVIGTASGQIEGYRHWSASAAANFEITIDSSTGQISVSFTNGSWQAPDNDLQIASTYSIVTGNRTATLSYTAGSIYQGTGLTGAGVAGGSLSWTNGTGRVDSATSWKFTAVE